MEETKEKLFKLISNVCNNDDVDLISHNDSNGFFSGTQCYGYNTNILGIPHDRQVSVTTINFAKIYSKYFQYQSDCNLEYSQDGDIFLQAYPGKTETQRVEVIVHFKEGSPPFLLETSISTRHERWEESPFTEDQTKELSWFQRKVLGRTKIENVKVRKQHVDVTYTASFGDFTAELNEVEALKLYHLINNTLIEIKKKQLDKRIEQYGK